MDFTNKSEKDLHKQLVEKREALRKFRFSVAGTKTRNIKEGMTLRHDIARILTELSARKRVEA